MMNQQQNAISLARVLAASLVGKSQAWNLVKHRPAIIPLLFVISIFTGCLTDRQIPKNDFIILAPWFGDYDTILYQEYNSEFREKWKLKGGRNASLMCGYTYDIFKTDSIMNSNWIAATNRECQTIVDDSFTYFDQAELIEFLISNSKKGIPRTDTIFGEGDFFENIKPLISDKKFLGYNRRKSQHIYSSTTKNSKQELEQYLAEATNDDDGDHRYNLLKPCTSDSQRGQYCGIFTESNIMHFVEKGLKFNSTQIGYIYETYWKIDE